MEYKKSGVFSPCDTMDSASMINSLQALLNDYPSITFTSVTVDKKYNGFKILFTEQEDSGVLEKNLLSSAEQPVWIYPLSSYLIILNVDHKKSPLFERELRCEIEKKFGRKVLSVLKTENSPTSKNWRIEIDIPEFKDLEVFSSSSSEIILPLAFRKNEEVVLKFWCRQCKMCGHFQHECLSREEDENTEPRLKAEENSNNTGQIGVNLKEQASSSLDRNAKRTPKKVSNFALENTEKYAEKIGREEVISKHMKDNVIDKAKKSLNNNLLTEKEIKKETTEFPQRTDTIKDKNHENKKYEFPENCTNLQDIISANVGLSNETADSSSGDDDIRILELDNSSVNKSPSTASNHSATTGIRNLEEESRSPEAKNTFNTAFNISNFPFPATAGPSYESPSAALKAPRGAEVTTSLSERLQDCINQVCANFMILDRQKLDAFLIHVKKKSNPIRVALNYTKNTKGLKEQLQGILHMYYNTPQTGTKEDIQFIKWLNGLVERYDGSIPKKRKRSGKTDDDDPPAKK